MWAPLPERSSSPNPASGRGSSPRVVRPARASSSRLGFTVAAVFLGVVATMRLDMFRRRAAPAAPSSPTPPSSTTSRSDSRDSRDGHGAAPPLNPMPLTRRAYIRALDARMAQMEKVPTRSFFHSYAGEFDMLQGEDRRALRKEHEFETSIKAENTYRNRYVNILSNEPTRIKLQDVAPGENDYINANLVTGHASHAGYIATQAPLPETMPHFWQMVYETVSPVVIMLTREQEEHCAVSKSEKYWPDVGEDVLFNDYLVHGLDENTSKTPGVIERRFQVARVIDSRKKHAKDLVEADSMIPPASEGSVWQTPARGRSQQNCVDDDLECSDSEELMRHLEAIGNVLEVVQLQYIDWPDQEVPENPETLLHLCARVDELSRIHYARSGIHAPPVVHCSAGVGRTGTYIAVDKTLRRLWDAFTHPSGANRHPVCVEEIRELVRQMKNERSRMVQTPEQYRFIYETVRAALKKWEGGQLTFSNRPVSLEYTSSSSSRPTFPGQSTSSEHIHSINGMASRFRREDRG